MDYKSLTLEEIQSYKTLTPDKLQSLSEKGDLIAKNELAFKYDVGNGVEQDRKKAYQLYLDAATQGLAASQYNIGCMWEHGEIPDNDKDLGKAMEWYLKAALRGDEDAQYKLGHHYETHFGNIEEAMKWYVKSAKQNQSEAIHCLSYQMINFYQRGYNIIMEQDDIIVNIYRAMEMLQDKIRFLETRNANMERYITELECLPPDEGGVMFQHHKKSFYNMK